MSSYKNTRNTRSTRNNFVVLDYEGNEVFDQRQSNTEPVTPTHRYNLRSRTRTTATNTPSTPQKPTHTRSMSNEIIQSTPLIFRAPRENVVVDAVAVDSVFNDTIVYEAEDGSIVLRGFTRGLSYFTERGATEDISDTEDEEDLSEFTYEEYGRGYLLYPPIDHVAIGQKYFFDAWWMPKFDAWFFKPEFLDNFISMGATEIGETEDEIEEVSEEEIEEENDAETLDGFCYVKHGRGYLLYSPSTDHDSNGEKYFYNAWWMPKYDAWFFRSQYLDDFIKMGVVEGSYSDDEESSYDNESDTETEDTQEYGEEDFELDGYTCKAYGRGFLLYSPTTDNHGTKYFHDAWWMPKHKAWFFRKQHLANFLDMGVTFA